MKRVLSLGLMLAILSCSNGDDNKGVDSEPKFILKTENISFQDAEPLPEKMWLSASSSQDNYNLIITDGVKNYTYSYFYPHWTSLPNTYQNTKKLAWSNVFYNGMNLIHLNGWNYVDNVMNDKIYVTANSSLSEQSTVFKNTLAVRSAGFVDWTYAKYIAGGSDINGIYSKDVFELTKNKNSEYQNEKITEMPEAKETSIEVIGYKLYVIGGYNGTISKRIDCYDLVSKKWSFLGNMPYGFSSHATCVQGSKIWIVGNYNLTDQQLAYFNTATNEFVTVNSNIIPRKHANAEIIQNKLYVFSGSTGSSSSSALTSVQVASLK